MRIRHKFHAIQTDLDGQHFSSRLEADYYTKLKLRQKAGQVIFFLRQVPFHLPGNTKYVCDFLEFHSDGSAHFVEVKGFDNAIGKLKIAQTEALYPIKIEIVRKGDF